MRILLLLVALFSLAAQEALTNEGIVKLVKAGLSEELVISAIADQPGSYALGATELVALKEAGVSEKIIRAMMAKGKPGQPIQPSEPKADEKKPEAKKADGVAALAPGSVYYRKNNEYFELVTEAIRWKTSGAMKSFASAGIIKKDVGGTLAGPSSRNFLQNPMEVILVPAQGMSINSFLLLPLKAAGKGEREFLVGPTNAKSGVAKGAIPFGVEKVGPNHFRLVLQTPLAPGEYGILPVLGAGSQPSDRLYTFRLLI